MVKGVKMKCFANFFRNGLEHLEANFPLYEIPYALIYSCTLHVMSSLGNLLENKNHINCQYTRFHRFFGVSFNQNDLLS